MHKGICTIVTFHIPNRYKPHYYMHRAKQAHHTNKQLPMPHRGPKANSSQHVQVIRVCMPNMCICLYIYIYMHMYTYLIMMMLIMMMMIIYIYIYAYIYIYTYIHTYIHMMCTSTHNSHNVTSGSRRRGGSQALKTERSRKARDMHGLSGSCFQGPGASGTLLV